MDVAERVQAFWAQAHVEPDSSLSVGRRARHRQLRGPRLARVLALPPASVLVHRGHRAKQRGNFFLDLDNGCGFVQLSLKASKLTLETHDLVTLRVSGLGRTTGRTKLLACECALLPLYTPLGHMRGVEAVAAKQFATAWVAFRIGLVFSEKSKPLGCTPPPLLGVGLR